VRRSAFNEFRCALCVRIVTEVLVSVWRQRLWIEPLWHAAALLLCVPRKTQP